MAYESERVSDSIKMAQTRNLPYLPMCSVFVIDSATDKTNKDIISCGPSYRLFLFDLIS